MLTPRAGARTCACLRRVTRITRLPMLHRGTYRELTDFWVLPKLGGLKTLVAKRKKKGRERSVRGKAVMPDAAVSGEFDDEPHRLTQAKRSEFLRHYAKGRSIESAANEIGFSRIAIFNLRNRDEEFAEQMAEAEKDNTDSLVDHLLRHATERGVPGNIIALFGILKARRPDVWRENVKLEHAGTITHAVAPTLLTAARERLEARAVTVTPALPSPASERGVPKH